MDIQDHIEDLAKEAAGNWKKFESFAWHDEPEDGDNWTIINTHHRDSDLLSQSNADAIDNALQPFMGDDCISMRSSHWGVGWVDGYAIRVYKEGEVTKAFSAYAELYIALQNYPVLDDEDYSRRELEASIENINDIAHNYVKASAPAEWSEKVWEWLWNNDQRELDNSDGHGAYPSLKACQTALKALGWFESEWDD
jgi:hypothetical protein